MERIVAVVVAAAFHRRLRSLPRRIDAKERGRWRQRKWAVVASGEAAVLAATAATNSYSASFPGRRTLRNRSIETAEREMALLPLVAVAATAPPPVQRQMTTAAEAAGTATARDPRRRTTGAPRLPPTTNSSEEYAHSDDTFFLWRFAVFSFFRTSEFLFSIRRCSTAFCS